VLADFPFIDELQKKHKKQVGFMFAGAIKGHIEKGNVLIAEAMQGVGSSGLGVGEEDSGCARTTGGTPIPPKAVGYLIAVDRYLKRDELGIIYQINVVPGSQRGLIAANLLKEKFERSAYGCRLYCCWCAQDLKANKFWEAMGFVPLAFRTGGGRHRTKKDGKFRGRMHIFWQKRIRPRKWDAEAGVWVEDDFPYWFPSQTGAGAIGEDRLVLPIPPGSHWSDAKPIVLPEGPAANEETLLLEAEVDRLTKAKRRMRREGADRGASSKANPKVVKSVSAGGLHFGPRKLSGEEAEAQKQAAAAEVKQEQAAAIESELKEAKRAAKRAKKKFDPAQEAFARELKDRWLEQVADQPGLLAPGSAKYEVSRGIDPGSIGSERIERMDGEQLQLPDAA
jgi:hypothetical protein